MQVRIDPAPPRGAAGTDPYATEDECTVSDDAPAARTPSRGMSACCLKYTPWLRSRNPLRHVAVGILAGRHPDDVGCAILRVVSQDGHDVRSVAWGPAKPQSCPDCGCARRLVTGEVIGEDRTRAVFLAFLYDHGEGREAYIDLSVGPWGEGSDPRGRRWFSTRTGPVAGGSIASTLLDGGFVAPDNQTLGSKITREEGLNHPLLPTVWSYLDSVLVDVPDVADHLANPPAPAFRRRAPWRRRGQGKT